MKRYVTYLRVSTQKQGATGLGLDAQRKMCSDFITANKGKHEKEFVDVESGTHRDRKGLWGAIDYCRKSDCGLVIAKLDRLARDVEFTFKVINTGIDIHFCDMPVVNSMILGVFSAVAQYERELCSSRTKAALQAKKKQGALLGAASPKYKIAMSLKSDKLKQEEIMERGKLRTQHYKENRDVIAFEKVIRRVFPDSAKKKDIKLWDWDSISCRKFYRERMKEVMLEYIELDGTGKLFCKWNFDDDEVFRHKLSSYMQTFRRVMTC